MSNKLVAVSCIIFGIYIGLAGGIATDVLLSYILGSVFIVIDKLEKLNEHPK